MARKKGGKSKSNSPDPVSPEQKQTDASKANGVASSSSKANGRAVPQGPLKGAPPLLNGTSLMTAEDAANLRAQHKQMLIDMQQQDVQLKSLRSQLAAAQESCNEWKRGYYEARWWTYATGSSALVLTGVAAAVYLARATRAQA